MTKISKKMFRTLLYYSLIVCLALGVTIISPGMNTDKVSAAVTLPVKVNVGGPAADGMSADQAYTAGSWGYVESGTWTATTANTINPNFGYPTAMQSNRYYPNFSYRFDVPNG